MSALYLDELLSHHFISEMQKERYKIFKSQDLEKGKFDVVFEIEGKKLHANSFVLTSVSEYMDAILSDRWSNKDGVVKIETYSYDDFCQFLCFLYTGGCEVTNENVFELVDMAEYFGVLSFKKFCDKEIVIMVKYGGEYGKKFLTVENVKEMAEFADTYSLKEFGHSVREFCGSRQIYMSECAEFQEKQRMNPQRTAVTNRFVNRGGGGNQHGYRPPQQSLVNRAPFRTPRPTLIRTQQNNMNQFCGGSQQQPEISAEHSVGNGKAPRNWMPAKISVVDILEEKGQCDGQNEESFDDEDIDVVSRPKEYDPQDNLFENFEDVGFPQMLLKNMERINYKNPRLIQKFAIPAIRKGFDVVGQSETASGKTAAYLLPIVEYCIKAVSKPLYPMAIIVLPTHELVQQIYE